MPFDRLQDGLRNVAIGLLTPFDDEDQSVNHDALATNAGDLYDAGARTFLACANISEYHSLTQDERIAVTETSVDALGDDAVVLAGVGGSTGTGRELIAAYDEIGVDGMMVMPPDHTYKHERGLLTYYRNLADATDTGLVPYVRGFRPSVEFLVGMTEIDGVAGIKYAIEDLPTFREALLRGDDDVVWSEGMAEPFAPAYYFEGAEGFTAGVSNFAPRLGLELYDALEAGEFERARRLRDVALPYQRFRSETGEGNAFGGAISVPAVKKGLELAGFAGFDGGTVRDPIVPLSDADAERAEDYYEEIQRRLDELV